MGDIVLDIKNRLSIEDVVAPYVELKKAGRNFKACCPFHSEKTPSFVVSPEKQIAYCFGCHKGGDMFKFIQEVEGIEFPDAVKMLADKAGVKADVKKFKSKGKGGKSVKEELIEMHEEACKFFESNLFDKTNEAKDVLSYLERREIKKDTIKNFRVGLAKKEFDQLYKHLIKKGYNHDSLIKSGLFTLKDVSGKGIYDKFRLRLMFPIFDHIGRVIGFGGRALKKDQMPKYLNSPETQIYSKGQVLYGLSHAKQSIKDADKIVVVEGYFDVISLHQEEIKNVVASSGTALTPEQAKLISRFTKNVVSCFDTDSAGINATKRAYEVLQYNNMNIRTIRMPDKMKDPADFMVEYGKKSKDMFSTMIEDAPYFLEYYVDILNAKFDVKTLEGRRKFLDEVIPLVKVLSSSIKVDHYVRILAKYLDTKERFLYDEIDNFKLMRDHRQSSDSVLPKSSKLDAREILIAIILNHPDLFEHVDKELNNDDFQAELKDVYIEIVRQYNDVRTKKEGFDFGDDNTASLSEKVMVLSLYGEERYDGFGEESILKEVEKLIDSVKKTRRMHKRIEIERALKEAEKAGDKDKKNELLKQFQELLTQ